jgi:hypothetical protein
MNVEQLLKGIVVVIDDELDKPNANINKIVRQLNEKNYPILKYKELDEIDTAKLGYISFLLLDWDLKESLLEEDDKINGVKITGTRNENIIDNMRFIREIIELTFCPIFIFSNQDVNHITTKLVQEKIILDNKPSRIFIKSKRDVENSGQLFTEIEEWFKMNPSMYVLKKWGIEYQDAINKFFNDFQNFSPFWPLILWECFKKDGANPSLELAELLTRNLHNRMRPFEFTEKILINQDYEPRREEIRTVLEGERFLPISRLHDNDIGTGDLFKVKSDYYLNIRPQCDLLRREEVLVYCVKGNIITKTKEKEYFLPEVGQFKERNDMEIIPFINNGKILALYFKEIYTKSFNEMKEHRIGRLLPPYITRIQQRFSLYLQRQGLPRIPIEAIEDLDQKRL